MEKDSRFLPALELLQQSSGDRLKIVHGDMLKLDEEELLKEFSPEQDTVKMMGNLPFNIATELTLKWLRLLETKKGPFVYGRIIASIANVLQVKFQWFFCFKKK